MYSTLADLSCVIDVLDDIITGSYIIVRVVFLFWYAQKDGVGKGSSFFSPYNGVHDRNRGRPGFLFFSRRSKILNSARSAVLWLYIYVYVRTLYSRGPLVFVVVVVVVVDLTSFSRSASRRRGCCWAIPARPFLVTTTVIEIVHPKIIDPLILDLQRYPFENSQMTGPFTELVRPQRVVECSSQTRGVLLRKFSITTDEWLLWENKKEKRDRKIGVGFGSMIRDTGSQINRKI